MPQNVPSEPQPHDQIPPKVHVAPKDVPPPSTRSDSLKMPKRAPSLESLKKVKIVEPPKFKPVKYTTEELDFEKTSKKRKKRTDVSSSDDDRVPLYLSIVISGYNKRIHQMLAESIKAL